MLVYYVLVIICAGLCFVFPKKLVIKGQKRHEIQLWIFVLIALLIFAGIRGDGHGDYWAYLRSGGSIKSLYDVFNNNLRMEYGYCVLALIINKLHLPAQTIIFAMNVISLSCIGVFIKRYSRLPIFSLFLFLPFYFQFDMHSSKTACALGIFSLATPYVINRKPIKFLMVLLAAILFHFEAAIGVFLYFLPLVEISMKSGLIILLIDTIIALPNLTDTIALFILKNLGWEALYIRYISYTQNYSSYAANLYDPRYILCFGLFLLSCLYIKSDNKAYKRLLINSSFFTIFIMIFFSNHMGMVTRLSAFYHIYSIILIPEILNRQAISTSGSVDNKNLVRMEYFIIVIVFSILTCVYAYVGMSPYRIFQIEYW